MKKSILSLFGALALPLFVASGFAAHHEMKHDHGDITPKTVIHVVTVSWKDSATPAQIDAALEGVKAIAKEFDGVTRVWTRSFKVQGQHSHAFVMEFKSEAALNEYAGSAAQEKWYETYIPIRERSTTFDITN